MLQPNYCRTVADSVETFVSNNTIPPEAVYTAEFVHIIDGLFDSLNSSHLTHTRGKQLKGALTNNCPHLNFSSDMLPKIHNWRIIIPKSWHSPKSPKFIEGWHITQREMLRFKDFDFLCLRQFIQDPVKNCFCTIRQHGVTNTNSICHQFIDSLNTVIGNNFDGSLTENSSCDLDLDCVPLGGLYHL